MLSGISTVSRITASSAPLHSQRVCNCSLQALSYACSQWASLPEEDVAELPADLLLALLADESLEARLTVDLRNSSPT